MGDTIRPKGIVYIIYLLIKYIFLIGLCCLEVIILIIESPFQSKNELIKIIQGAIIILGILGILILLILQTREVIRYKIIIYDNHIDIAANRELFLIRHKDMSFDFSNIQTLQYKKMLRPDLLNKGMFYFSVIYIKKLDGEKNECLLTMWFSKKQIQYIMEQIKIRAEKYNKTKVEVLLDDILK